MSAIDDDPGAELRALRERAYGPGADIHDDPAAMQRLRELEDGERVRPAAAAVPGIDARRGRFDDETDAPGRVERTAIPEDGGRGEETGTGSSGAADAASVPGSVAATAVPERPEPQDAADPAPGGGAAAGGGGAPDALPAVAVPWWRRRMPLLWAGSLVVAALLGAGAALSMQAVWAGQVAVLSENPGDEWPEGFFSPRPEGGATFDDFLGLTPVRVPQEMGPDSTLSVCLYVLLAPSNGMMGAGCSAGTFPATAAILVTEQLPAEVLERFEPGTALQFVLDGSQVRVYAAAPAPGATP